MSTKEKLALTLQEHLVSPREFKKLRDITVPWEVKGYLEDFILGTTSGGLFDLSDHVFIEIKGKEAQDYLQRMTTVQFKTLEPEQVVHGAFLNGRGGVIALGVFRKVDTETFQLLVSHHQKNRVLEHIEQFHFAEEFSVKDLSDEWAVLGCWSQDGNLARTLGIEAQSPSLRLQKITYKDLTFFSWKDVRRSSLFWIVGTTQTVLKLVSVLLQDGVPFVGRRLFEFFRLEAAIPWAGDELSEKDIILEGDFEEVVARNKGCYPGQEVVERIFTYGQVNRKLRRVTLALTSSQIKDLPMVFFEGNQEVGQLVSWATDPRDERRAVGLMFVRSGYWDSKAEWVSAMGEKAKLHP
jgi:folate-binding protein YgfZ